MGWSVWFSEFIVAMQTAARRILRVRPKGSFEDVTSGRFLWSKSMEA
jgi:hypothetical protein